MPYQVKKSKWIEQLKNLDVIDSLDEYKHYRLCFNACAVLDVEFKKLEIEPYQKLTADRLRRRLKLALYVLRVSMSTPYDMAFACLECQRSFKRQFDLLEACPESLKCPRCGGEALNFGRHFKAPRKTAKRQWDKIRFLVKHGFRFQKIRLASGRQDSVAYPETLEEAREFIVKFKDYAIKSK